MLRYFGFSVFLTVAALVTAVLFGGPEGTSATRTALHPGSASRPIRLGAARRTRRRLARQASERIP